MGIFALLFGFVALVGFDVFGVDDYVPSWLADLLALVVMFALIAAIARGAPPKQGQPRSS